MRNLERTTVRIEKESSKDTIHREELENERRYLIEFRYMRMNKSSEMMGFVESNWKESWIAPEGWKELSQLKTIMRGWPRTRTTNLRENGQDLEENSSSMFKCREWRRETPSKLLRYSGRMKRGKVEPAMKRIWKRSWRRHMTDGIHTYIIPWKEFGNNSGKLEESGKILGKDLWVRAH